MKDGIRAVSVDVGDRFILARAKAGNGMFPWLGERDQSARQFSTTPATGVGALSQPIHDAAARHALLASDYATLCMRVREARGIVDVHGQESRSSGETDKGVVTTDRRSHGVIEMQKRLLAEVRPLGPRILDATHRLLLRSP